MRHLYHEKDKDLDRDFLKTINITDSKDLLSFASKLSAAFQKECKESEDTKLLSGRRDGDSEGVKVVKDREVGLRLHFITQSDLNGLERKIRSHNENRNMCY